MAGPGDVHTGATCQAHQKRHKRSIAAARVTGSRPLNPQDEDSKSHVGPRIVRKDHSPEEALALSAREMAMHMSFRSGVPLLTEPRQGRREQERVGRNDMQDSGYLESFEELRYQADVSCPKKLGSLLVDEPEHRNNMQLWIELLHFRQRLDGLSGIVAIWRGVRQRNVDIPTEGTAAQILWSAFISAITVDRRLHPAAPSIPDLFAYAVELKARTGKSYADLYTIIVGRSFRVDAAMASNWHRRLKKAGLAPEEPLKLIVKDVVFGERMKRFQDMYKRSGERDLYDIAIGAALQWEAEQEASRQMTPNSKRNDLTMSRALRWHRFLLRYGDGPSQEFFTRPEVQRLFELDGDESLPMIHAQSHQVAAPPGCEQSDLSTDVQHYPSLTRANFSSFMGEAHGIKQKEVSDNFVAKMFATRAFPLDLVINGLTFFSVNKVGGVALREMALREVGPVAFCNRLTALRAAGISLDDSVYTKLLCKLAEEVQTDLYETLLASDQHPDAYSDSATQEALLVSFLGSNDWTNAHVTLLALESTESTDSRAAAWNRVAQHYLRHRAHKLTAHTIETMQRSKLPLTYKTMMSLHRYVLPARRRRMKPVESQRTDRPPFDALNFVTRTAMYADGVARASKDLRGTDKVKSRVWIELLKRYGMKHRWAEFEKLVHWLASNFGGAEHRARVATATPRLKGYRARKWRQLVAFRPQTPKSELWPSSPLPLIFDRQMQQAIVTWGFRSAAVRNALQEQPRRDDVGCRWWQGLSLLMHLRKIGVQVDIQDVRRALWLRMWILFGPGVSQRHVNMLTRKVNRLSLERYITTANEIWATEGDPGTPLFDIPSDLLDDTNTDPARLQDLLAAFFGRHAHVHYDKEAGLHEYVDIQAWSSAVATRQAHYPSTSPQYDLGIDRISKAKYRQLAWANSPLRVALGLRPTKRGKRIEPDRNGTWLSRAGRERVEAQAAHYDTLPDEDD
ncbi:hypothetical protein D0862_02716 [Hortaea werneckii]|uniref:Pentatricopeptide repeat domain-containing protein n=2 Tax=Hortaea werneckii TaxID=91943 RepID=A0A3M7HFX0_HORWE|nr:hypothetical protein D0862_02716 [Hortaea werneckii]